MELRRIQFFKNDLFSDSGNFGKSNLQQKCYSGWASILDLSLCLSLSLYLSLSLCVSVCLSLSLCLSFSLSLSLSASEKNPFFKKDSCSGKIIPASEQLIFWLVKPFFLHFSKIPTSDSVFFV